MRVDLYLSYIHFIKQWFILAQISTTIVHVLNNLHLEQFDDFCTSLWNVHCQKLTNTYHK